MAIDQPDLTSPSPLHQHGHHDDARSSSSSSSSSFQPPLSSSRPKAKANNNSGGSSNMKLLSLLAISVVINLFLTLRVGGGDGDPSEEFFSVPIDDIIMQPAALSKNITSSGNYLFEPPSNTTMGIGIDDNIETVLIIATVPYDATHAMALWTALECVTEGIDKIVISAPDTQWSRDVISTIMREFELRSVNHTNTGFNNWKWEAAYYTNNRYDVGLWCDALGSHLGFDPAVSPFSNYSRPRAIFLINDSVIVLRKYKSLTNKVLNAARIEQRSNLFKNKNDTIAHHHERNLKLVSLNGRLEHPGIRKYYYVESVYRGLTPGGVSAFYNYTCNNRACFDIPEGGPAGRNRMSCIVDRYEIGLAGAFADDEIDAMFPTKMPKEYDFNEYIQTHGAFDPNELWIHGKGFWWYLYREQDFRFRKTKGRATVNGECLKLLDDDESWFGSNLPFPSGETLAQFRAEMIDAGANIGKRARY